MARTKLHQFMDDHEITNTELSREAGVSVRYVDYVKLGQMEPRRHKMALILDACRRLTNRKSIRITDLFDFDEERKAG